MKKLKIAILTLIICVFSLAGCKGIAGVEQMANELIYIVTDGTYTMESDEEQCYLPSVTFHTEDSTFSFSFDLLSSYSNHGTYTIEKDEVVATTSDGNYTFVFKISDDNMVSFVADKSSSTETVEGITAVPDGAVFTCAME